MKTPLLYLPFLLTICANQASAYIYTTSALDCSTQTGEKVLTIRSDWENPKHLVANVFVDGVDCAQRAVAEELKITSEKILFSRFFDLEQFPGEEESIELYTPPKASVFPSEFQAKLYIGLSHYKVQCIEQVWTHFEPNH